MPLNLLYFRSLRKVIEIMELRFQEEWQSMGRPKLDLSLSASNSFLLSRHILFGRYEGSGDDDLQRITTERWSVGFIPYASEDQRCRR